MKNFAWLAVGLASLIGCGDDDGTGAASTGAGGSGAAGAGPAGAGGEGAGGGELCGGVSCATGYLCCEDACVDPSSNLQHCGGCDVVCDGATPYCDGSCKAVPCEGAECDATETCCGTECCDLGTSICCYQQSGAFAGPGCSAPTEDGNCSGGCHDCP